MAGVITGSRMAASSLTPSLMPRSAIDQGLVMAASFVTGYLIGSTAERVVGIVPVLGGVALLQTAAIVGAGAHSSHILHASRVSLPGRPSTLSAWAGIGSEALSAMALSKVQGSTASRVLGTTTGAVAVAHTLLEAQSACALRDDDPDASYLAAAVGTATGTLALAGLFAASARAAGRSARRRTGTSGITGTCISIGAALAVVSAAGLGAKIALGRVINSVAARNRTTELAYADVPGSSAVSGSANSHAPFATLGLQGRRLVSEATTREVIEAVMGEPARNEPVRVYIGIDTAASHDEQVELAVAELRRAGGFQRSTIIAASPTGTGYVNYIALEAADLMARGDIATVTIQYGALPSILSTNAVEDASTLYKKLIRRLRREIDSLGGGITLYAYGESLGARTGQSAVDELQQEIGSVVDGALWVGTPHGTPYLERLVRFEGVPVFDGPGDLHASVTDGDERPVVVFLSHDNDPVTKFTPSIFYTMPEWLRTPNRGRGVSPNQRWIPGVAFWQGLVDTKNAATVIPGEFKSTNHDYRGDLASFIRVVYGFSDVSQAQMQRIDTQLRSSELRRAANIAEGRMRRT